MRIKKPPFIRAVFWFDKILQGSLWNVIVNFQVFDPFEVSDVFGDDWYAELESCCGDQEIDWFFLRVCSSEHGRIFRDAIVDGDHSAERHQVSQRLFFALRKSWETHGFEERQG